MLLRNKAAWSFLASLLFGILILTLLRSLFGYNPLDHLLCETQGDNYIFVTEKGVKKHYCVHSYTDGGKSCTNSQECEGDCLLESTSTPGVLGVKYPPTEKGVCATDNAPYFYCYPGTIENPFSFCS